MEENKNQNYTPYAVPASIVMAGFIIAAAVVYSNNGGILGAGRTDNNKPAEERAAITDDAALDVRNDDRVLGDPAAKVTIIEYADFQCPFCGRFFTTTLAQVKDKYVKSGEAKIVYRDFAFLGTESVESAEAARCAGEQNRFWDYHDYLYTHQNGENQGAFSNANLKKFALELGFNSAEFNSCLDSHKFKAAVEESTRIGQSLGVNGTPTTFIGGREIVGAQPFSQVEALIQEALKNNN